MSETIVATKSEHFVAIKKIDEDRQMVFGEVREVEGHKGYYVTENGQVLSCRPVNQYGALLPLPEARVLRQATQANGYRTVVLDRKTRHVHVLVCKAFHGDPPTTKHEVRHWNGDKDDCSKDNVLWGTRVENGADRIRHGTQPRGYSHAQSILTPELIDAIQKAHVPYKTTYNDLAVLFGISRSSVAKALRGGYV